MSGTRDFSRGTPESSELRALDRELHEIEIEERCSFGPELRSDLANEYQRLRNAGPSRSSYRRIGIAAGVVVALTGSALTVSQVRDGFVAGLGLGNVGEVSSPPPPERVFSAETPAAGVEGETPAPPTELADRVDTLAVDPTSPSAALPVLRNRSEARRIVAEAIPPRLDEREAWGKVELLIWVNPEGIVELPQIDGSSGFAELDRAALKAVQSFEFEPATRLGVAVGTWVRFAIGFQPESARVLLDVEAETMPGSGNN